MNIVEQILKHQQEFPDKEICGFVLSDGLCWPMKNVSDHPDVFMFDVVELRNVITSMSPVAMYHTHLNEEPIASSFDLNAIDMLQMRMYIVDQKGDYKFYDPS